MKLVACAAVCLWLAEGLQLVASRFGVFGVSPDFVIVVIVCLSLFSSRAGASGVGFIGGLIQGAAAGSSLAGYVLSRSIVGFCVGWTANAELNKSLYIAPFVAAVATIVGQIILLFTAPTPAIGSFLVATIGSAIYNGVIAVPVFALLRRLLDPPRR
jgi:rod shape-determining protein MreD